MMTDKAFLTQIRDCMYQLQAIIDSTPGGETSEPPSKWLRKMKFCESRGLSPADNWVRDLAEEG